MLSEIDFNPLYNKRRFGIEVFDSLCIQFNILIEVFLQLLSNHPFSWNILSASKKWLVITKYMITQLFLKWERRNNKIELNHM
jgi:hypothetical protein